MAKRGLTKPVAALLLLSVAALELASEWRHAERSLTVADYRQLRAPIERMRRDGEAIVVHPKWAEPRVRHALGNQRMPADTAARADEASLPSLLLVNVRDAAHPFRDWSAETPFLVGALSVQRFVNPHYQPPRVDFLAVFGSDGMDVLFADKRCHYRDNAFVSAGGLGGHPTFAKQRYQCPGGEFFHVGKTTIADEQFAARRCLWAHPPKEGQLLIRYRDVPLGTRLRGHGGMYWMMERDRSGAPVQLVARVDGEEVGRAIHADGDGWSAFDFPLGRHAGKEHAVVEWRVSSPDHRHRHFCFEARSP